jgi:hypothetical protein
VKIIKTLVGALALAATACADTSDAEASMAATQDAESERLTSIGAALLGRVNNPDGTSHLVMQDVEGNEFCIT